jgi:hypothetical protein
MQLSTLDIFEIIQTILARNLEIDPEIIDLDFKFHGFIDRLAAHRREQAGAKDLFNYLEAANIYIDLVEKFEFQFLTDFTSSACITVADLILIIKSKSELGFAGH